MNFDDFISRLEGVKRTGKDSAIARCPAHQDKSPSLTIRDVSDRLLIHCFAGCDSYSVMSAVGLELSDLFPERLEVHKPERKRFMPQDVIKCLAGETLFMVMCAEAIVKGEGLTDGDLERMKVCHRRFNSAAKAAGL